MTTLRPCRRTFLAGALLAGSAVPNACSRDRLLEVQTPDQIPVDAATIAAGAAALRAAAIGNFNNFYSGTTNVGANVYGGLVSDELVNARPGADHIDQRAFNPNTFPNTSWNNFSQAYTQLIRARTSLRTAAPNVATTPAQLAQLYALSGMALTVSGELFCNGVPLSNVDDVTPKWEIVTNAQMFTRAVAQFDSALAITGVAADIANVARVGKGRAQVDLGQWAAAATTVSSVTTGFVYNAEYSQSSLVNVIYDWMVGTANFSPSDKEGANGLDFVSARDPRIQVARNATSGAPTTRLGQDGTTPAYTILNGFTNGSAPTRLATGVEARMIEAEAALQAGNTAGYLAALNAARADPAVRTAWGATAAADLPPLTDPGTAAGRQDLLFRERAFWMYLTTHRVGDLRRLVRQYARPATSVWPSGAYFKGGTYGTDQNITPSFAEANNPDWKGCTDRNP